MTMSSSGRPHASPASRFARTRSREVPERYSGQVVAHLDDGTEDLQQLRDAGASNHATLGDEPADSTIQNALVVAQNGEPCIQRGLRGQFAVQLSCGAQLEELTSDDEGACDGIDTDVNSSITRYAKVIPPMLTSSLATRVQMISLRAGASPGADRNARPVLPGSSCAERLPGRGRPRSRSAPVRG